MRGARRDMFDFVCRRGWAERGRCHGRRRQREEPVRTGRIRAARCGVRLAGMHPVQHAYVHHLFRNDELLHRLRASQHRYLCGGGSGCGRRSRVGSSGVCGGVPAAVPGGGRGTRSEQKAKWLAQSGTRRAEREDLEAGLHGWVGAVKVRTPVERQGPEARAASPG